MRYVLLLFFVFLAGLGFSQRIQIEGVEVNYSSDYPDGPLYVIRRTQAEAAPEGQVSFVPGGDRWEFGWTYEGSPQAVAPYEDSTRLAVPLLGNGLYTFTARKDGVNTVQERFYVFYDFMDFKITLTDVLDCEYITIHIDYLYIPDFAGFPGGENVDYWVDWDGKERQLSSMNDYRYEDLSQSVAGCAEDVSCRIRIKDRFGFVWESNEVTYESMIPEAVPELTLGNTVDVVGEVGDEMGQAPLEVEFDASGSKNASSYEWYLYKDTTDLVGMVLSPEDSLIGNQIRTQEDFVYTYEHSGRYKVMLVGIHGKGNFCRDTSDIQYVNVVESLLDVPNVFTPNGDGKNDIFKVKALSLESFQGVILNRWGRKIYEWNDPSEGWDGRIGGKYASPGTYFYVITAKGREKVNPPKYVKKGALLLVR